MGYFLQSYNGFINTYYLVRIGSGFVCVFLSRKRPALFTFLFCVPVRVFSFLVVVDEKERAWKES